jgi:hypothetical protein
MSAHHLDRDGCCVEDCPSTEHDGQPVVVAIDARLKPMFDDWVDALGLAPAEHTPTPPEEPVRAYVLRVPDHSPWLTARSPF